MESYGGRDSLIQNMQMLCIMGKNTNRMDVKKKLESLDSFEGIEITYKLSRMYILHVICDYTLI